MTYTIKTQQKMMCMQAEAQPQKHQRRQQQDVDEHGGVSPVSR